MTDQFIVVERQDGVETITLNRPEVLNSFNRAMGRQLQEALDVAAADGAVRAVLLTGAGRAFCAGQDLAEAMPADLSDAPPIGDIVRQTYNPIVRRLRAIEKPVVAAVNGVAAGAGANLALACDLVLAADTASFVQAFSKIGLIPDTGGTFLLPRLVGMQRAAALAFLGDKLPAADAQAMGLVHRVVPAATLMEEARALAARLAGMPTRALGITKRAFNMSLGQTLDQQLDSEAELQAEAGATHDYREGVSAFLAKRAPKYEGR